MTKSVTFNANGGIPMQYLHKEIKHFADFPLSFHPNLVASFDEYRAFVLLEGNIAFFDRSKNEKMDINQEETPFVYSSIPLELTTLPRLLRCNCDGTKILLVGAYSANILGFDPSSRLPFMSLDEIAYLSGLNVEGESLVDIQFSPVNPNYFVAAFSRGTIRIINATSGECEKEFKVGAPIKKICFGQKRTKEQRNYKELKNKNTTQFNSEENSQNIPTLWAQHTLFILTDKTSTGNEGINGQNASTNPDQIGITHIFKLCPLLFPGDKITDDMIEDYEEDINKDTLNKLKKLKEIGLIADVIIPPPTLLRPDIDSRATPIISIGVEGQMFAIGVYNEKAQNQLQKNQVYFAYIRMLPNLTFTGKNYYEELYTQNLSDCDVSLSWTVNLVNCPYLCSISKEGVERIWITHLKNMKPSNVYVQALLHCKESPLLGFSGGVALLKSSSTPENSHIITTSPFIYGLTRIDPEWKNYSVVDSFVEHYKDRASIHHKQMDEIKQIQKDKTNLMEQMHELDGEVTRYEYFIENVTKEKQSYEDLLERAKEIKKNLLKLRMKVTLH